MEKGKKPVIIYGGSFDPPHKGHAELAAAALRQLRPSALYLVPGYRTPFKDCSPEPYAARAAMLRAAFSGVAGPVMISAFEAARRRVVYTWETVEHFSRLHPGAPLYFLMGSDCLAGFMRWNRPDRILRRARLLVGLRPGHSSSPRAVPFAPLSGRFPDVNSTALRAALFLGRLPAGLSPGVRELIVDRGLYLWRERALLRRLISVDRYAHSLHTAELAMELAPAAGVPQRLAAVAALLHDCARDLPAPELRRLCAGEARRDPLLRETLERSPVLAHAWAGARLAAEKFGFRDADVAEAIRLHATGAPGMGPLARLVYLSDLANRGRDFPEAELVRRMAFRDLGAAFKAANYVKLTHAFSGGGWVHPLSVELWNSLQEEKKG